MYRRRTGKALGLLSGGVLIVLLGFTQSIQAQTGTAWAQLSPAGEPPSARFSHSAVHDPTTNRTMVFGGSAGSGFVSDIWLLTNANGLSGSPTWTQLSPTDGPPNARAAHTAIYDPAGNRLAVFGGQTNSGPANDVWVLTNANGLSGSPAWTQLSPTDGPPSMRYGHSAVYDPASNRMVVFGGFTGSALMNDVWVLTNANGLGGSPTWTQLSPAGGPPNARSFTSTVYDPTGNRMIVFGGLTGSGAANDVWVLTNANGLGGLPAWTQLSPTDGPASARFWHSAIYDPASNRLAVFGGQTNSGSANDVWVLTNANGLGGLPTWTQLSPTAGPPPARYGHSAVHDPASNRLVVFGGFTGSVRMNDVWVLTKATGIVETIVAIDIKPGGDMNSINPGSHGVIPVAILSKPGFDAPEQVDRTSLTFGRTGTESSLASCTASPQDVDKDGLADLLCHFYTEQTGFQPGDTQGFLRGKTYDGQDIAGADTVRIID